MKNFLRRIFSEEHLKELKEKNEKLQQRIEALEQEIKKLSLTDEVGKAIKEKEIIEEILAKELKKEKDLKNKVPKNQLSEFFSISLYRYSKQLSKLTKALLIVTTILIILAITQIIIVLT